MWGVVIIGCTEASDPKLIGFISCSLVRSSIRPSLRIGFIAVRTEHIYYCATNRSRYTVTLHFDTRSLKAL